MTSAEVVDLWPRERVAKLSRDEVLALRENAIQRGVSVVVGYCDAELAKRAPIRARRGLSPTAGQPSTQVTQESVDALARLIQALPPADKVPNAQHRLKLIAQPVSTFSGLWRLFIVCGFSSQERSDPGTPLDRFARSGSPLLDLPSVLARGSNPQWISDQLAQADLRRFAQRRLQLISSARGAFVQAIAGDDDTLANGNAAASALSVFIDLASGRKTDNDLGGSEAFSASIDASHFYGIGHKQIRNILVNSGLARNVIPIDSRWASFSAGHLSFKPAELQQISRYLAIEHALRRALHQVSAARPDIANLSVLDAIVFASQSPQGYEVEGWAGT